MAESLTNNVYQPLGSADAVRLLKFTDGVGPVLRASLVEVSLNDPHLVPFMTVSYTWGNAYSDQRLILNGYPVPILQSVAPLLHMLTSNLSPDFDSRHDYLWVDSICIDQANLAERASQVKLMRRVYRQASQTLVWLGEQSEDTDRAIDFLVTLGQRVRDFRRAARRGTKRMPLDLEGDPGWACLDRLLHNPWWRRVWTLQEFLIPRDLSFYCGSKFLSRQSFRHGMDVLELIGTVNTVAKSAMNRRRVSAWYQHNDSRDKMSLVSLLAFCGDYEVTDPRDRIWGLHGLAREEDRKMIGRPTYAYDLETLYTGLVGSFVETHKSLDIICFAHIFSSVQPGWPSWVPDWRVRVHQPAVVPLMVSQSANEHLANFRPISKSTKVKQKVAYKASGDEPPRTNWDVYRRLTCQGLVIDIIDGLSSAERGVNPTVASTSPANTRRGNDKEREVLLQSLARSLVLDRMDNFLEQRMPGGRQYAKDLLLLVSTCAGLAAPNDSVPSWFFWWWHNRRHHGLKIRGFTLEEICTEDRQSADAQQQSARPSKSSRYPDLRVRGFTPDELCARDEQYVDAPGQIARTSKSFFTRLRGTMMGGNKRLAVTELGHIALAPRMAQKGDMVCVLFGCSVPVVLRKIKQFGGPVDDAPLFRLVGECYLDGYMDGEALQLGQRTQEFMMI